MRKTGFVILLACALLLSGCSAPLAVLESTQAPTDAPVELKQFNATFLTLFDTVTTVVGKAETEEAFTKTAQAVHDKLEKYHQLFDIYNTYEGVSNLKTVNDMAGIAPVHVDAEIIALLRDCVSYYEATNGRTNVMMGSVLSLWHEARSDGRRDPMNAKLPDEEKLRAAAQHTDIASLIIDEEAGTVYISDPEARLDVGAVAKGWSVQRVADQSPEGLLLSVGGNVAATGPKDASGTPWVVGVQDPDGGDAYIHTLNITKGCVVTSGDYQRTYVVDGKFYHHIIDPDTLYPSEYWQSVTVLLPHSGAADALSTALFILPLEEGKQLCTSFGAECIWVDQEGNRHYSDGFMDFVRK